MMTAREDQHQAIEPMFLSAAKESGVRLSVSQMNKAAHEGTIKDIGRYEINLDVNGRTVTLLKQEISSLTAPYPLLTIPVSSEPGQQSEPSGKPNIQKEFLDKAIKENQSLTVFLINGQRIKAHIEAYDNFTLLLREGGRQHLFYKHAISTINR